jgi:hypothetical protein
MTSNRLRALLPLPCVMVAVWCAWPVVRGTTRTCPPAASANADHRRAARNADAAPRTRNGLVQVRCPRRLREKPDSEAAVSARRSDAKLHTSSTTAWWCWWATTCTGGERPQDFKAKFEIPYKPLLDAGVKFLRRARQSRRSRTALLQALQHERASCITPSPPAPDVRFFMLESTLSGARADPVVRERVEELDHASGKIPVFPSPPYSSGDRHGSDIRLREVLEPRSSNTT